ncbi:hypothetical protein L683_24900 [Pseudomonas aeruginosa WC55]|nr:hypothetical protein L683_24900 [Pseudomonas aeruginosa WC55]
MLRPDILGLHIHDVEPFLSAFLAHGYNFLAFQILRQHTLELLYLRS